MEAHFHLDLSPSDRLRAGGLRKALRIGINRAASPVKGSVVSHAEGRRRYGFLAKSIRIRLRVYPADRFAAVIGPSTKYVRTRGKFKSGKRAGQKKKHVPAKYAHLVERGTKFARPRPWLKPAFDATAPRFLDQCGREIWREIQQELARRAMKGGGR